MKSQVLHTVWCNISGEAAGEIWNWSLLGVKGLRAAPTAHALYQWFLLHCPHFLLWSAVVSPGGKPLFFPCGNLRRETIPQEMANAGMSFIEHPEYCYIPSRSGHVHFNPFTPKLKNVNSPNLWKRNVWREVVRIGGIIIFHPSKLWKSKFFILRDVIFLVRLWLPSIL